MSIYKIILKIEKQKVDDKLIKDTLEEHLEKVFTELIDFESITGYNGDELMLEVSSLKGDLEEELVDNQILTALNKMEIKIIEGTPYVRVREEEEKILDDLIDFCDNYNKEYICISRERDLFLLHGLKDNKYVILRWSNDINKIAKYLKEKYNYIKAEENKEKN